jgi:hypothetical protein
MAGTVVIGAGQAASQLVATLRAEGYDAPIVVVGDEPYPPYQRPPLSKKFLAGELTEDRLYIKPPEFYDQAGATLKLGVSAVAVDRAAKTVTLSDGTALGYDSLVFATGSRVRKLTVPGSDLPAIHYLRGIDDVKAIQPHFHAGKRMVVVGGGYIGLETAAVAAKRGLAVTVVEAMERCLQRVTSPLMSDFFQSLHRAEGVVIQTETGVTGFEAAPGGGRSARDERRLAELGRRLRNAAAHSDRQRVFDQVEGFARPFLGDAWRLGVLFEDDRVGSELVVVARDGELPSGPRGPVNSMESLRALAAEGKPVPRVVPIDRLSSGQRAVLALCYPFVFGDRPVDLALIDEPEEHIQPSWQRSFLGAMRRLSPQTQFVVATHSPHVLDSVAVEERCRLTVGADWGTAPLADAAE